MTHYGINVARTYLCVVMGKSETYS